jgi:integrase
LAEIERRRLEEIERQRLAAAAERRLTVRGLFDRWQRAELAPHVLADGTRTGRKDGGEWVKASFERRLFPVLGDRPADEVSKADLLAILDDCKAGGQRRTANVLLADIRQMFRFAAEREIVQRNPLDGIKRTSIGGKDVERDRCLSDDELRALWAALPSSGLNARSVAAVKLILATACRVGEAMGARWEHVTLQRDDDGMLTGGTWYLPTTKNERDHTIHLSALALAQVEALAGLREMVTAADGTQFPTPWVFPATDPANPVCIKSFGKQLADRQREPERRMKNRAKNTTALVLAGGRWTAHDLRRTAATIMARVGVSTDVIDECLNHKLQSKVARVYIKDRRIAEQARAFDALGARLSAVVDGTSNVVQLRAAA